MRRWWGRSRPSPGTDDELFGGSRKIGAMGFLHRHEEMGGTRYRMREKLFAIGDDYWIETENGDRVFKVNGKAMRIRETFILETPSGEEVFKIQEKKLSIRD